MMNETGNLIAAIKFAFEREVYIECYRVVAGLVSILFHDLQRSEKLRGPAKVKFSLNNGHIAVEFRSVAERATYFNLGGENYDRTNPIKKCGTV